MAYTEGSIVETDQGMFQLSKGNWIPVPADSPSLGDTVSRQLGLTARAGIEGALGLPSLLAEIPRQALNLIPGVDFPPQGQAISELLTKAGLPSPETPTERVAQDIGGAVAGAGGAIGAGQKIGGAFGEFLASQPASQAFAGGIGAGASGVTRESGGSPAQQSLAGLAGLLAPGAAMTGRSIAPGLPTGKTVSESLETISAGERAGVPVKTTDIFPPSTFPGKISSQTAEKIPFIGTGSQRASQQGAREVAVEDLAQQFDVGLDAPLEKQIIASLKESQKAGMKKAANLRRESVDVLSGLGDVPMANAVKAIDDGIAKESTLGARSNESLIKLMQDTKSALNGDFGLIGDVRTRVIQDIKKLQRGEHEVLSSQDEAALQSIKSAIDVDMKKFATSGNRDAAAKWVKSNKLFSDEFTKFKGSELKRLLAKGDITPEVVAPVLRGGKISELTRLNNNLTNKGRSSAKAAIIRDALSKSGYPNQINPDRLATEFSRQNTQKAINVFFKGDDKKQLEGLVKLLNATRRAQQAGVTTPTGQALIPFAAGGATVADPLVAFLTAATLSGSARAYESSAMRNLLIRIAKSKEGSTTFEALTSQAMPIIQSTIQAAPEEQ